MSVLALILLKLYKEENSTRNRIFVTFNKMSFRLLLRYYHTLFGWMEGIGGNEREEKETGLQSLIWIAALEGKWRSFLANIFKNKSLSKVERFRRKIVSMGLLVLN